MFICPHCQQDLRTLGELLQCCPRELRAYTDQLIARDKNGEDEHNRALARLLTNHVSATLRREVAARLAPTHQEAA